MEKKPEFIVGGGPDRLGPAVALNGESFKTDPVFNFLLHTMPEKQRTDYIPQLMFHLLKAAALKEACFDEAWTSPPASDSAAPACSAVWLDAGRTVDDWRIYIPAGFHRAIWNVGLGGAKRMMFDFQSTTDKMKRKHLRNPDGSKLKDFDYLFFISTAVEDRGKGIAGELVRRRQVEAAKKGVPIWLEATTAASRRLYTRLGFKEVGTWTLGKGQVDKDGHTKSGGEGVPMWAMLWWPEKETKGEPSKITKDSTPAEEPARE